MYYNAATGNPCKTLVVVVNVVVSNTIIRSVVVVDVVVFLILALSFRTSDATHSNDGTLVTMIIMILLIVVVANAFAFICSPMVCVFWRVRKMTD
jgi:Kef-type K+ transport system membrane component KefB